MRYEDRRIRGPALVFITFLLVVFGCALYYMDHVGWAQLLWVMASGTAGAGIMAWLDDT